MKIRLCTTAIAVASAFPMYVPSALAQDQMGEAVVVTATRQQQRADETLASVDVITREQIERAGHSTLTDLLAAQPGIQISSNGGPGANTGIFIRGANSGHTLVLVDGMRIGSATSGQPALEVIPTELIERVEILRGPASALYGSDAIGGVIQIFTRKGEAGLYPSVRAGVGTERSYTLGASLAGGQDRLRYSVSAGRERTDGFNVRKNPSTVADRDRDGFHNDYLSASASLGLRDDDEIGLTLFHSEGRNWYDSDNEFNSRVDKGLDTAGIYLRNKLADGWVSTLRLGYSEDRSHSRGSSAPVDRFDTEQTQFAWQNDISLGGGLLLAAVEHLEQRIDTTGTFDRDTRRVDSALLGWGGQFGKHHLQVNARHDDDSQFGGKTTGLLAYGYQILPEWRVRGSVGTAFKAPTFNDLYFPLACFPPFGCFGGNPDLKPEESLNREIGVVWERGGLQMSATYYNNRVKNLIQWGSTPDNVGKAKLEGLEWGVSATVADYRVRATVDLLDAKDEDSGERLVRRARRAASLGIDRSAGKWSWGAEWRGQSEREDGGERLGGYGIVNAWVHHALTPALRLELRANNVFDKDYTLARNFATAGANAFVALRYTPR
ncbi:TonB-dependent receptor domain-containing protein [Thauera linaloolentis]|uniref:TonB-dependent receptor plug n=1 Tax=Thauera linaloolentis (strain DSM 12138 / JCM 21573 / CCUG 41526 / CIP 105981 / IAM 15112 / NBRC 102519 / 47Lol) TaxID=1123367 RepID=N6Y4Y6_THAL4|nr:TonB-dependent receptor [Thauera linaloolentis]ENO86650.1 TonB-dependent receptor plug [Thauera linaloolentis 47Lol = DSM 12138]MCM8564518.1 TonB-dependent receptor [Thauera linaloolentis]